MEVTAACASGIGVPVGFASADREVLEAACRWDLARRRAATTRSFVCWWVWFQESSGNELGSSVQTKPTKKGGRGPD